MTGFCGTRRALLWASLRSPWRALSPLRGSHAPLRSAQFCDLVAAYGLVACHSFALRAHRSPLRPPASLRFRSAFIAIPACVIAITLFSPAHAALDAAALCVAHPLAEWFPCNAPPVARRLRWQRRECAGRSFPTPPVGLSPQHPPCCPLWGLSFFSHLTVTFSPFARCLTMSATHVPGIFYGNFQLPQRFVTLRFSGMSYSRHACFICASGKVPVSLKSFTFSPTVANRVLQQV